MRCLILQLKLEGPLLRNVPHDDRDHQSVLDRDEARRETHRKRGAVSTQSVDLIGRDTTTARRDHRPCAVQRPGERRPGPTMQELLEGSAHAAPVVTLEHGLGRAVDRLDDAVGIDGDDSVCGGLDDGIESTKRVSERRFHLGVVGDIAAVREKAADQVIIEQGAARHLNEAPSAVLRAQADPQRRLRTLIAESVERRPVCLQVTRMHQVECVRADELLGPVPEYPLNGGLMNVILPSRSVIDVYSREYSTMRCRRA